MHHINMTYHLHRDRHLSSIPSNGGEDKSSHDVNTRDKTLTCYDTRQRLQRLWKNDGTKIITAKHFPIIHAHLFRFVSNNRDHFCIRRRQTWTSTKKDLWMCFAKKNAVIVGVSDIARYEYFVFWKRPSGINTPL